MNIHTELTQEQIKEIICSQLPGLMEQDPRIKEFVLRVTRTRYADRDETSDRFDRILQQLREDREKQTREWDAAIKRWEENDRKWDEAVKRWEENDRKWDEAVKRWEENDKKWAENVKRWEENDKNWADNVKRWEENDRKWDQAVKRWEENDKKWAENVKRWEENDRKWDQAVKRWEENDKKWAENNRRWHENQEDIRRLWSRVDVGLGAIGARWGMRAEGSFREALKGILEKSFGVRVERYLEKDAEGKVFGRPDQVEIDVLIRDGVLILCEIKSSMSKSDMYAFVRKVRFYQEKKGKKAQRMLVISPMVDDKAKAVADLEGVEVYGYPEDVQGL